MPARPCANCLGVGFVARAHTLGQKLVLAVRPHIPQARLPWYTAIGMISGG
jgi:hypothetical protein